MMPKREELQTLRTTSSALARTKGGKKIGRRKNYDMMGLRDQRLGLGVSRFGRTVPNLHFREKMARSTE